MTPPLGEFHADKVTHGNPLNKTDCNLARRTQTRFGGWGGYGRGRSGRKLKGYTRVPCLQMVTAKLSNAAQHPEAGLISIVGQTISFLSAYQCPTSASVRQIGVLD